MNVKEKKRYAIVLLLVIPIITSIIYSFVNYNQRGILGGIADFIRGLIIIFPMLSIHLYITNEKFQTGINAFFFNIIIYVLFFGILGSVIWLLINY
jgi:hypothetical protein